MKNTYLLLLLLAQFVVAQAPDIEWQKTVGGLSYRFI